MRSPKRNEIASQVGYLNHHYNKNKSNGGDGRLLALLHLFPGIHRNYTYTVQLELDI